ncbi:MAG: DMT family transporter [Thermoguttaceae bacterium]|nr:DMT family transporter [Thermoguttaceae bacterium]
MSRRQRWIAVLSIIGATFGWGTIPVFLKHLTMTRGDYLVLDETDDRRTAENMLLGAPTNLAAVNTIREPLRENEADSDETSRTDRDSLKAKLRGTKVDPWTLNGLRYGISALFWLPFLLPFRRKYMYADVPEPDGTVVHRSLWRDALLPAGVNSVSQAAYGLSFLYISASTVGFSLRLSIIPTIFFGYLFLREERQLLKTVGFWGGTLLSFVGLIGIFQDEMIHVGSSDNDWLHGGGALALTMVFWGAYSVAVQKKTKIYSSFQSFAVISLYTAIVLVIGALIFGDLDSLSLISAKCWREITISALIGIALGHVLYYYAIAALGSIVASSILLLSPIVTKSLAMFFLGEPIGWRSCLGGSVLILGGFAIMWAQSRIAKTVPLDIAK